MPRRPSASRKTRTRSWKTSALRSRSDLPKAEPSDGGGASKPRALAPGLYLVATPIGNAADLSLRALEVLGAADLVACEDTRVTGKLLAMHRVSARLAAYHEHNAARVRPGLVARIAEGGAVALVSDAGTPSVSDPGYKLVRACVEAGLTVTAVPGANAALAALTISGLPTDRFLFAGFLPGKRAARRSEIAALKGVRATLLIQESPARLAACLADLADLLGAREAAIARELTKLHEEVRRGMLGDLARHYAQAGPPKGEVVVVVGPPGADEDGAEIDLDKLLAERLATDSLSAAVKAVAAETGIARRRVYARALELQGGGTPEPSGGGS